MKAYNNRNNKRSMTCRYCFHDGHNKRNCPTMKAHWEQNKDAYGVTGVVVGIDKTMFPNQWRTYYGDHSAVKQFQYHWQYMQGRFEPKAKVTKPRKPSKCGFCGDTTHTRRKCSAMTQFVDALEEANKAYRKKIYDVLFKEYGLGIGAFVKYQGGHWTSIETGHTLILDIDYDSLSIGNVVPRWSDYHTEPMIIGMSDKNQRKFNFRTDLFIDASYPLLSRDKLDHFRSNWGNGIVEIIAPAPSIPDEEWFVGQSPAFDWVAKKKSLNELIGIYRGILSLYHPEGDLVVDRFIKKIK